MPTRGRSKRSSNRSFKAMLEKQRAQKLARASQQVHAATPPELNTQVLSHNGRRVYWYEDDEESSYDFWLVQRLDRNRRAGQGWFNHKFELDYMGSAEFESGAAHCSLDKMRAVGDFMIQAVHLTRRGMTRSVFCIAPRSGFDRKLAAFTMWASQDHPRAKEWTNFETLFDEDFRHFSREYIQTVAWWSLGDDILWTLDLDIAEDLLYGLQHPASS